MTLPESNTTMQRRPARLLVACALLALALESLPVVHAFSSIAAPYPNHNNRVNEALSDKDNLPSAAPTTTSTTWRVVLDIGREPLSSMPFDWARSGGRMPIKIPTQIDSAGHATPVDDTFSVTGPDGAVTQPIQGGKFLVSNDQTSISLDLHFPAEVARRDITIPAGSTLTCTSRLYTKTEMDALYQAYYDARDEAWQLGGELNDMVSVQGPPKVWNEEAKRWEKRSKSVNPLQWAQKRLMYAAAKTKQDQANQQRPDYNDLSERGALSGVADDYVYVAKNGVVKTQTGAVIGKWSMEPMLTDRPVSYRK